MSEKCDCAIQMVFKQGPNEKGSTENTVKVGTLEMKLCPLHAAQELLNSLRMLRDLGIVMGTYKLWEFTVDELITKAEERK